MFSRNVLTSTGFIDGESCWTRKRAFLPFTDSSPIHARVFRDEARDEDRLVADQ